MKSPIKVQKYRDENKGAAQEFRMRPISVKLASEPLLLSAVGWPVFKLASQSPVTKLFMKCGAEYAILFATPQSAPQGELKFPAHLLKGYVKKFFTHYNKPTSFYEDLFETLHFPVVVFYGRFIFTYWLPLSPTQRE